MVKGFSADFTDTDVGLIMSIPFIFAMFSMPWWGLSFRNQKSSFASAFFRLHVDSGGCSGGKLLVAGVGEGIFS
ncbi:hypothetical protein A3219_21525 [Salmonella enterica]|nr:hypothetical protein A3219_21525 [Salmonella enterica]